MSGEEEVPQTVVKLPALKKEPRNFSLTVKMSPGPQITTYFSHFTFQAIVHNNSSPYFFFI